MSTRRTHRRLIVAAVLAALVVPVAGPASALAVPADVNVGDTPAEFGQPVAPAPKIGDTKSDSPGASRAPLYDEPRTITVVRPERTIVRDTESLLPIALSGAALLVALDLAGTALIRMRSPRLG